MSAKGQLKVVPIPDCNSARAATQVIVLAEGDFCRKFIGCVHRDFLASLLAIPYTLLGFPMLAKSIVSAELQFVAKSNHFHEHVTLSPSRLVHTAGLFAAVFFSMGGLHRIALSTSANCPANCMCFHGMTAGCNGREIQSAKGDGGI